MPTREDNTETTNQQSSFELSEDEGLSAVDVSVLSRENKRVAPRYVRDDIAVALCEITPFSFGKEIFVEFVKLNDITGRGISFSSSQFITVRKKIILNFRFHSDMTFKISASIVYRSNISPYQSYQYGVKFDNDSSDLSDHLLETQRKLVFK